MSFSELLFDSQELLLTNGFFQALDEEAEVLVKKLWRMIIFFSESEKRGLPA